MHDASALVLDQVDGTRLDPAEYKADFRTRRGQVRNVDSWKFERRQHFEENTPGRDAFRRGDWGEAMTILEGRRAEFTDSVREDLAKNTRFCRVRIVVEPLSPYLRWELCSLRVQAECGKPIRVVSADVLAEREVNGLLPEVVILGGRTLYEVVYTDDGVPDGAVRFTDPTIIDAWTGFINDLYGKGENVIDYVARLPSLRQ
jgi:hypothetical protein